MKVIDASGLILGRLLTKVAKLSLMGEEIHLVNCEKAVITGSKKALFDEYLELMSKGGPFHGPFVERMPDKFVKIVLRSMLPFKNTRGREAYRRVTCYIGVPEKLKKEEMISFPEFSKEKITRAKLVTIGDLSKRLGAKYHV